MSGSGCRISTFIPDAFEPGAVQDWDALESPSSYTPPSFPPIVNERRAESHDPYHSRSRSNSGPQSRTRSTNSSPSAQAPRRHPHPPVHSAQAYPEPDHYVDSPETSPRLRPRLLAAAEIPTASNIMSPAMQSFPRTEARRPRSPKMGSPAGPARAAPASVALSSPPKAPIRPGTSGSTTTISSTRSGSSRVSTYSIPIMPPPPTDEDIKSMPRPQSQRWIPLSRKNTWSSDKVPPSVITDTDGRPGSSCSIPRPPPAPNVPLLDLDFSYRNVKLDPTEQELEEKHNTRKSLYRMSGKAGGTIRRHLGTLIGTIKRPGTSGGRRGRERSVAHDGGESGKGYSELRAGEDPEDEAIGVDISTWGSDFAVPTLAAKAMEERKMDPRFAYTGTGEAIDLSNLVGLDNDSRRDSDVFSLHRAGTMENSDKNSYYFPPDRTIPNWKPVPMRTPFILTLLAISVAMVIGLEMLYQKSNSHGFRPEPLICPRNRTAFSPEELQAAAEVARNSTSFPGLWGFCDVADLSITAFATWKYIPTIIGVIYGILWKVTDTEVKRCEPYYQLSKGSKGALAASSLNIEYDTFWSVFVPFAAFKHRQWVVVCSSVASLFAFAMVPTLLSVVILTTPDQNERQRMLNAHPHLNGTAIEKDVIIDARYTRLTEAFLIIIILLGSYVLYHLIRRRSGLIGDPSGIAGVAAMANKSHILMDFKDLDQATEEQIHKQLNKRTYILHKGALWQAQLLKESERDTNAPKALNAHPLLLRTKGMLPFMGFTLFVLVLTPILVYNPTANVVMNKAPWFIIGLSMVIKSLWEIVEKDMRMTEPFWQLYNRNADSSILTLDYTATIPGAIVIKAIYKGHYLLAWVSFVTLLIEVLSVVMGSVDNNGPGGEESTKSQTVSFGLSIAILVIIMATMNLLLYYRRKTFLPRQPGTISSVLAFIHQSKMLTDFDGTEEKTTLQRKRQLEKIGRSYGFGWFVGRDGKRHLGIDHEPLLDSYKFGKDPRKAVADGPVGWDHFEHIA